MALHFRRAHAELQSPYLRCLGLSIVEISEIDPRQLHNVKGDQCACEVYELYVSFGKQRLQCLPGK